MMKRVSAAIGPVEHLPSRVATYISREIAAGRLKPGEKLPTESEFAEMLGVSRQSLYVKLRRYGLGDLASEAES